MTPEAWPEFAKGDVIQARGESIPRHLWAKWWIVIGFTLTDVQLSEPYDTQADAEAQAGKYRS